MVVLFHTAWGTALELCALDKFSKPTTGHSKRSSFYIAATNAQNLRPRAVHSIARRKHIFGEQALEVAYTGKPDTENLPEVLGEQLVRRGRRVWLFIKDKWAITVGVAWGNRNSQHIVTVS
ncbi:LOW QUALITY PROTEIN: ftsJ-like methyltransferase family protein [Colletotrichum tofieldiae]|nr:LOW QUALITY PROTEIN: ftsJ-like methyltransferase family protein [Colletotrichum tofieldiae]